MSTTPTLAVEPASGGGPIITLAEAKTQVRVDAADASHDAELTRLLPVVTDYLERRTQRQFITATWQGQLDKFPAGRGEIIVPRPPLIAVNSITYVDEAGAPQTLATTVYEADLRSEPGRIVLKPDQFWPAVQTGKHAAVTIDFDAGFGPGTTNVPEDIRHAALMLLAFWFDNHDAEIVGATSKQLDFAVEALVGSWFVPVIG